MDADSDLDQDLWNQIVSMGWTGIRIPEQYEGLGLGHLELCVIAEELRTQLAKAGNWPSHVFLQAGVGGLACALLLYTSDAADERSDVVLVGAALVRDKSADVLRGWLRRMEVT